MSARRQTPDRVSTAIKETSTVISRHRNFARRIAPALAATLATLLLAGPAQAAPAPHLSIASMAGPSRFVPGDSSGGEQYAITVTNTGSVPTDGSPITITDTLPTGLTVDPNGPFRAFHSNGESILFKDTGNAVYATTSCAQGPPMSCSITDVLYPGDTLLLWVTVDISAGAPSLVTNQASVSGGGAPPASVSEETPISTEPAPFGFQELSTHITDAAGAPVSAAGSHPYLFHTGFQLNNSYDSAETVSAPSANFKDIRATLPPGFVVNPQATPELCTEAQLEQNECPDASAVGVAQTTVGIFGFPSPFEDPIFNTVAPTGAAANLAYNVSGFGIFIHLLGGVDTAGDYGLTAAPQDILQYASASGAGVELWGSPTDPSHDYNRGDYCDTSAKNTNQTCPVSPDSAPFLTMPSACSGPLATTFSVDSWQHPGDFITESAPTTDENGNPVGVSGCSALAFAPTLQARPTTSAADSPTGLSVDVHVPQTDNLNQLATANLKKAVVTLPKGLVVNPSGANGLDACSSAQIGLTTPVGQTPIHFSADHPSCPDAAKIGTVEVDTPLLADPLQGSVYIAKPHDNPFGSLLAIYIVIDDPQTGVIVKLAGHVEPDPQTGQLTTTFDENPQLPFSDFKLSFFQGANAALRTPETCGAYSSTSQMTPWSGNPPVAPHDDYSISSGPNGSACVSSTAQEPNAPSFDAGTITPLAGSFSPFVLNLERNDGSQQFSQVITSPPPGLVAKLAGTPACSDAALSAAASRSGQAERANPSCPSASQVGTVDIAAGAGPSPYWTQGKVYMAGPYQGAPLSFAIVTPAVAGPFDLGVVVTRVALHINPTTAQITATSDPIPSILQGIPLDVRSVRVRLDKPNFTLNGTSCDPSTISGSLLSTLGQTAQLSEPFQLGECGRLPFKPQLSLKLKGGIKRGKYPQLTATLTMPEGSANLASVSVALPHSEFLAQEHIGTVCTRVQFAASECPAESVYGTATVQTPILGYPLTGNVYLRSSSNELPDLVPDLRGPASQPIELEADGRTDSIHGGIRNSFEYVPDAPFTKFTLQLAAGHKSLLVNSTNICAKPQKATVIYTAHNGAAYEAHPLLKAQCPKKSKKHAKRHKRSHKRHAGR